MTVRRLQDDFDIQTNGVQFISEREEIAQTILTRLKLFFGEYFRDTSDGTPWFQQIMEKNQGEDVRDLVIKQRMNRTNEVLLVTSYDTDFDFDSRSYSIVASVATPYGQVEINTEGQPIGLNNG